MQTLPDPQRWGQRVLSLLPFCPTVDGDVLPAAPVTALADGASRDVRLLTGGLVGEQPLRKPARGEPPGGPGTCRFG